MSALTSAMAFSWSSVSTNPNERLHLGLPRRVGAEGVALDRQPAAVELDQLLGHLAGRGPRLGPGALPVGAAHLRERGRLAPAVGGDGLDLVDREVEPIAAPVLQDQIVTGGPAHRPRGDPLEAGHPVLAVHHEAPDGQVVEEAVGGAGPRSGPSVRQAPAGDVGFGQHGHLAVRKDEAAREGRRHHEGTRSPPAALVDDRGMDPFFGQHGRQPGRPRRRGGAQGDGVALPDQLRHLGRQPGRVPGHRAESPHRHRRRARSLRCRRQGEDARPCCPAAAARRAGGGGGTHSGTRRPRPRSGPAPRPAPPPRRAAGRPGHGSAGARRAPPGTPGGSRSGSRSSSGWT